MWVILAKYDGEWHVFSRNDDKTQAAIEFNTLLAYGRASEYHLAKIIL